MPLVQGKLVLPPGTAPTLARLLEGIAKSMTESEVEERARSLEAKLFELGALLKARGADVPSWALAPPKSDLPN